MKLNFTKMQGAGNDYIYIDCRAAGLPPDAAAWAVQLSRRHFSVGADGVIYLCPPLRADGDAAMRMFNADGSEGVMCGNGVRCAAEFLYTHGVRRDCIRIDTPSAGQRVLHRVGDGLWQVEMGRFTAAPPAGAELAAWGRALGHHPAFPGGINVEFAQPISPTGLAVTVWERGSGATLACGTGACAVAAAAVLTGRCPRGAPILVQLPGGTLEVCVQRDDTVLLTGDAAATFSGTVLIQPCKAPRGVV